METPVIFIIFNRPENASVVFEEIRKAKPKKLYVVADGPRENIIDEKEKCEETRKIIEGVDWECEVIKDFSTINLGCRERVYTGITNAFKYFDHAIILEDDCVPHPSFFKFCEEMLEKYKDDERIMSVSGDNFLFEKSNMIKNSYYFSAYPYIWGWATWKRAWKLYEEGYYLWPKIKNQITYTKKLSQSFNFVYDKKIDTWCTEWTFANLINSGLTIVPRVNLVSNIGFGENSTHTKIKSQTANMPTEEMPFPLSHPQFILSNEIADKISSFQFTKLGIILGIIKTLIKKYRPELKIKILNIV